MKRFFTLVAAALMTSAFATSAFAGWGPNGMFGNADPNARPVGQSSRPSTNPASAPILNPPDPTKNLGGVPGSYKDPVAMQGKSKAYQAMLIANAKKSFDKKQNSPRFAPQNLSSSMNQNNNPMKPTYTNGIPFMPTSSNHSNNQTSGYGGNNSRGGGFFGNDVLSRGQSNNYPQHSTNNYPTNNYPTNSYPSTSNYPSKQSQFPMGGYGQGQSGYGGQSSSSGWGGYGGNAQTSGYGGSNTSSGWGQGTTSGYGGASSNSGYGMFAR